MGTYTTPAAPSRPEHAPSPATRSCALLFVLCLLLFWALAPSPPARGRAQEHFPLAGFGSRPPLGAALLAAAGDAAAAPPAAHAPLEALVTAMESALLLAHGSQAAASACSTYLAPVDPHEWAAPCDAACAREELDHLALNFGAATIVDLSGSGGGALAGVVAGSKGLLTEASLLRAADGEEPGSVALAVLAARALGVLGGAPALFLLPSRWREPPGAGGASGGGSAAPPPRWVREELPALPPALRTAIQEAYRTGLQALLVALSSPAAVLAALLPALAPAGARQPQRSTAFLLLPPSPLAQQQQQQQPLPPTSPEHAALGSSDLNALKALVCALAPGYSVEVQASHVRVYAPLRAYTIPPRQVPPALWAELTDGGAVPVRAIYYNQASTPNGAPVRTVYDSGTISVLLWKAGRRETEYYEATDRWLYALLDRHPGLFAGKRVAVLGSLVPWYECIALAFGASEIFTVEYSPRESEDARFHFVTPAAMEAAVAAGSWVPFDVAISISSFEHDGLGRYGDPLNGVGDLNTMAFVRRHVVVAGGLLILAVPTGRDCLVFNEQRVYGSERLPRLLEGWKVVDSEGMDWARAVGATACDSWFQPVWLLQSPEAAEAEK
jgi:hypothetical protein